MPNVIADVEKFGEDMSDERLAEIVLSTQKRATPDAHAALKELVRRNGGGARNHEVFRRVLEDAGGDPRLKAVVAVAVGTKQSAENRELLESHLGERDATVFRRIAQALGRIGDERTLEELEKAQTPDDAPAQHAHAFARTLISYRLRLDRHRLATPAGNELMKVQGDITFQTREPEPETAQTALEDARKDLPAVELASEGALELECRGNRMLLLFTDGFWKPEARLTLRERAALFMVLLEYSHEPGRYFLKNYFFTHPPEAREDVAVLGTRPSGELTYAGGLYVSPDGFRVELGSVPSPYAPAIDVSARYEGSWAVERALTSTTTAAGSVGVRHPSPAVSPPRLGRG